LPPTFPASYLPRFHCQLWAIIFQSQIARPQTPAFIRRAILPRKGLFKVIKLSKIHWLFCKVNMLTWATLSPFSVHFPVSLQYVSAARYPFPPFNPHNRMFHVLGCKDERCYDKKR
jgi:hypothetical protein